MSNERKKTVAVFLAVLMATVLTGCQKVADPTKPMPAPRAAESDVQVVIERVGEQVVGVRASKGDVKVLAEVPATERDYRAQFGEAPKRYLFSSSDICFYTYDHAGKRVMLKAAEQSGLR